jgi:hypothetical protein
MPTKQLPLVGEVVSTSADIECHVVSVTDPYDYILGFHAFMHATVWYKSE